MAAKVPASVLCMYKETKKHKLYTPSGVKVDPNGSFGPAVARNWARIPNGSRICHRGCAYTLFQTVQMPGVCSYIYGTVYYKEALKSFEKSRALSRLRASFCHDIAMIVQKAT